MNENNENRNLPEDAGEEAYTETFRAEFNDQVVESSATGENNVTDEEFAESAKQKRKKSRKTRKISTQALIRESNLASRLSAISIILLVAIAALLATGILPVGTRMVYVNVSSLGPVGAQSGSASAELLEEFKNSVVIIDLCLAESQEHNASSR